MSGSPAAGVARSVLLVALFAALTAVFCYPLSTHPGSQALDLGPDTRLYLWTLLWDAHALSESPWTVFDANIFYPRHHTLAYSEHLLGTAVVAAPLIALTDNPVLGMNAALLVSVLLSGLGAYYLARCLGCGVLGAIAAGLIFAFTPPRFFRLGQVHLATTQWMPFCLAFLHRYLNEARRRHLLVAVVFFTAQALSGGHNGLFLLLACCGLLVYLGVLGDARVRLRPSLWGDFGLAAALLLALNGPFVLPYLSVRQDIGLKRSLEEAEAWSPNASSFLASPAHAQRLLLSPVPDLQRHVDRNARGYLFPGFLTLVLAAWSLKRRRGVGEAQEDVSAQPASASGPLLIVWDGAITVLALVALAIQAAGGIHWEVLGFVISASDGARAFLLSLLLLALRLALARRRPFAFETVSARARRWLRRQAGSRLGIARSYYLLLTLVTLWCALGPSYGLYAALYRLVPGFDFIRAPQRLTLLTVLGLSVLAGWGLERLGTSWKTRTRRADSWIGVACLTFLCLEFAAFPLETTSYELTTRPAHEFLASQRGSSAVVMLPVADPRDTIRSARLHSLYMIYSRAHWRRMVNGYSGTTPATHDELFRRLTQFPDDVSLKKLEAWGVGYAILHRDLYRAGEWERAQERVRDHTDRLRLVHEDQDTQIYQLIRSRGTAGRNESM